MQRIPRGLLVERPHDEVSNANTPEHVQYVVRADNFASVAVSPVIERKGSPLMKCKFARREGYFEGCVVLPGFLRLGAMCFQWFAVFFILRLSRGY